MPKDTFYFSHDYHARSDKKMIRMLARSGVQAIGIYWCLVEMLYEEGGYLGLSECDCIADELRTTVESVEAVVKDFKLFENDGSRFWSVSVLNRLEERKNKSVKAKESASNKWNNKSGDNLNRSERLAIARTKGTHTKEQWSAMLEFFNFSCVRCDSTDKIVKDHIIPIYQGGSDGLDNLQPLCQKCNCSKGSENTDHRIKFCIKNACEMPAKFIKMPENAYGIPAIKEIKGKEIYITPLDEVLDFFKQTRTFRQLAEKYKLADLADRFIEFYNLKADLEFKNKSKEDIVAYFSNSLPNTLSNERIISSKQLKQTPNIGNFLVGN